MADEDIELKFRTTTEGDGAETTADALDDVADKSREAKAATDALTASTDKLTEARKKAASVPPPRDMLEAMGRGSGNGVAAPAVEWDEKTRAAAETSREMTAALNNQTEALNEQAEATKRAAEETQRLRDQEQQRQDDVGEARKRLNQRKEYEAATTGLNKPLAEGEASMAARAASAAAILGAAKVAGDAVRESIREYQELRAQVGGAMTDQEIFLNAVADTLDVITSPLEALKNGLKGLAGLDDLEGSIKNAAEMKRLYEGMVEARQKLYDQTREAAFESAMQRQRQEIDNQTAALQRQLSVLEKRRALTDAKADQEDQRALAGGADPNVVAANRIARDATAEIEKSKDAVDQSRSALEAARANKQIAENQLSEAINNDASLEAINAARKAVDDKGNALTQAAKDLQAAIEEQKIIAETISTRATTDIEKLTRESGGAITTSANEAIKVIEAAAQEQGGKLSSLAQQSLDRLYEVVRDGIPDSSQADKVTQAVNNFKNSNERVTQAYQTGFSQVVAGLEEAVRKVNTLEQQVNVIRQRLGAN